MVVILGSGPVGNIISRRFLVFESSSGIDGKLAGFRAVYGETAISNDILTDRHLAFAR